MHDKILNTSGIHDIEELYSGYVKEEAQKYKNNKTIPNYLILD